MLGGLRFLSRGGKRGDPEKNANPEGKYGSDSHRQTFILDTS